MAFQSNEEAFTRINKIAEAEEELLKQDAFMNE